MHINLGERFSNFDQAWQLTQYIANSGVPYFSFIHRINLCAKEHSFFGEICPVCGGEVTDNYIIIVGYLTKQSTYQAERAEELEERQFYKILND